MRTRVLTAASVVLLMAVAALAQFGGPRGPFHEYPNIPYDGQFTFVRLKYTHGPGGNWYGGWPAWGHGYPLSEQNLMRIMQEVSFTQPARRRDQRDHARRSGAVPLSARLHHRGRLVGDDRSRGGGAAHVPAEGRLRDRRRLQAAPRPLRRPLRRRAGRRSRRRLRHRMGGVRAGDATRPAGGQVRRPRRLASDLPLVLRGRSARHHPAGLHRRAADLPRAVRGQRSRTSGCR